MCIRDSDGGMLAIEAELVEHGFATAGSGIGRHALVVAVSYTHLDVYKRQVQRKGHMPPQCS